MQERDGGFPLQPGGASNSQSTAWAAQALLAAGAPIGRALAYLRARVAPTGAVYYAEGVMQTPVWVTAEALAALARRPLPIG
jgi:energy-coupling factor transport system substrate-specific component